MRQGHATGNSLRWKQIGNFLSRKVGAGARNTDRNITNYRLNQVFLNFWQAGSFTILNLGDEAQSGFKIPAGINYFTSIRKTGTDIEAQRIHRFAGQCERRFPHKAAFELNTALMAALIKRNRLNRL